MSPTTTMSRPPISRRAVLKSGSLLLASAALSQESLFAKDDAVLKVALVTDLHYADKPAAGSRLENFERVIVGQGINKVSFGALHDWNRAFELAAPSTPANTGTARCVEKPTSP